MKSNLKKLNSNQVKAVVELNQEDLQKYIEKAENMLGEEVEVKGFRRGKAPKDLIKKHVNQEGVRALALELAVEQSLSDAARENSLDVLDTSQLSIEKNDSTELKYSIVISLFPRVELADLNKIKIKRKNVSIGESEIADALEIIKNSRANFINKGAGEFAEKEDRVEVDFEVRKDGDILEGGISKNHPLIIGGKNFIPGFEDQLIGMNKGEEKEFSLTAPDDYFYKGVAGKKLDFKVKLLDIKKVIKPDINDDFARSLGKFADLAELRNSVRSGLTQEKTVKESQKLRLEILDNIISRSEIEVPDNLLKRQLDTMVSDFDSTLHEKGLELGLYLARIGKTQEKLTKDWEKDAEKQVKISLVLRKLSKDLKLEATDEEVEEVTSQAIQSAIAKGENSGDIDPVKLKENIAVRIINEKALEYLESRCSV